MSTYNNQTFASLGVTPGTYVWTWGGGGSFRNFTLIVGAAGAAIPEPAALRCSGALSPGYCWQPPSAAPPTRHPYPAEDMVAWLLSQRVGNVRNNDPSRIAPIRDHRTLF